jgi:hypothetical protein
MADAKRTFVVHIGSQKTGTSAIQASLFALNGQLAERSVSYPNLTGAGFGWQAERGLSNGNGAIPETEEPAWRELLERCRSKPAADVQIVSYEGLAWAAVEEYFWQDLAAHAEATESDVAVVVYLRDPFPFLLSAYSQAVKTDGCYATFEEWLSDEVMERYYGLYRHLERIADFAISYGCRLRIYRYEDSRARIVEHFLETACGISIAGLTIPNNAMNHSLGVFDLSFHRGVNSSSQHLGRLLGWERMDSVFRAAPPPSAEPERYELSHAGEVRLLELFEECRAVLGRCTDFGDRVDYSIDHRRLTERYSPEEARMHEQCFALGRFVAKSYASGYIAWDFKNSRA